MELRDIPLSIVYNYSQRNFSRTGFLRRFGDTYTFTSLSYHVRKTVVSMESQEEFLLPQL